MMGADNNRLAAIQIDVLNQLRRGNITLEQLEWFLKFTKEEKQIIVSKFNLDWLDKEEEPKKDEMYTLVAQPGIIIVPEDYDHGTQLKRFRKKYSSFFSELDERLDDQNYSKVSTVLKPGDRLAFKVFRHGVAGPVNADRQLEFLIKSKALFLGLQGLTLAWEQKHDRLIKNYSYISFDVEENLPDFKGEKLLPQLNNFGRSRISLTTVPYRSKFESNQLLMVFTKV